MHRRLPDMTQATLSKQLKYLEECGVVYRNVFNQIPPKVEYSLTEIGKNFLSVLDALETLSKEFI